jgi:hypothetical protein
LAADAVETSDMAWAKVPFQPRFYRGGGASRAGRGMARTGDREGAAEQRPM